MSYSCQSLNYKATHSKYCPPVPETRLSQEPLSVGVLRISIMTSGAGDAETEDEAEVEESSWNSESVSAIIASTLAILFSLSANSSRSFDLRRSVGLICGKSSN